MFALPLSDINPCADKDAKESSVVITKRQIVLIETHLLWSNADQLPIHFINNDAGDFSKGKKLKDIQVLLSLSCQWHLAFPSQRIRMHTHIHKQKAKKNK